MTNEELIAACISRAGRKLSEAQDLLDQLSDAIDGFLEGNLPQQETILADVCIESLVSSAKGWLIVATELSQDPELQEL